MVMPADLPLTGVDGPTTLGAVTNGRPAVVNLWATWCGPCQVEKPALNELARQEAVRGNRIAIVSIVAFDDAVQNAAALRRAYGRFNAPALTPLRATPEAEAILVRYFGRSNSQQSRTSLPVSALLDTQGRELGRIYGAAVVGNRMRLYWTHDLASRMIDRLVEHYAS
jgi:thiol-disulfide isomerase/thioredoxin